MSAQAHAHAPTMGILVTSARHADELSGLARSAAGKGVRVCILLTGLRLSCVLGSRLPQLAETARIVILVEEDGISLKERGAAPGQAHRPAPPVPEGCECMPLHCLADLMKACDRWVVL